MVDVPNDLPKGTPPSVRHWYAISFAIAAFIAVWAYAFNQAGALSDSFMSACRGAHVCGPVPLKPLQPLASPFEPGNTVSRAAAAQFDKYSKENPDWDICIRNTRSLSTHDEPFNSNYRYRMEGEFYGVPKWRGLWARITDFLSGSTYSPPACPKS
jgi:hypothetical protein